MKTCYSCGNKFETSIIVNNKRRNLQRRLYCLSCSPFKKHNTKNFNHKALIPMTNGVRSRYKDFSDDAKNYYQARSYWIGRKKKQIMLNKKGGKCQKCGYDKCYRALQFHHRDRKTKCFNLNSSEIYRKSLQAILAELEKCDLLCSNCHAETEDSLANTYEKHLQYKDNFKVPCQPS